MIYKFKCLNEISKRMEVEKFDDNTLSITLLDLDDKNVSETILLNKSDLYHLIGALHLIQKQII